MEIDIINIGYILKDIWWWISEQKLVLAAIIFSVTYYKLKIYPLKIEADLGRSAQAAITEYKKEFIEEQVKQFITPEWLHKQVKATINSDDLSEFNKFVDIFKRFSKEERQYFEQLLSKIDSAPQNTLNNIQHLITYSDAKELHTVVSTLNGILCNHNHSQKLQQLLEEAQK